jgi:hypothetical protein
MNLAAAWKQTLAVTAPEVAVAPRAAIHKETGVSIPLAVEERHISSEVVPPRLLG